MKKHSIFIITLLLLAGLAGCAGQEPDKTETEYPSAVSSTAETASASKVIDRSPAGTVSSSAETKLPEPAPTEQQKEKTEEPVLPETSNPEKPTAPVQESSAPSKSTSAQTQKPAKPPKAESSSPPPAEEPQQSEPPQESTPPEEPTVPDFNIQTWIDHAKTYAVSVGLRLESSAVDCWDNPITASAHSLYLERDIESRLSSFIFIFTTGWTTKRKRGRDWVPLPRICLSPAAQLSGR